MEIRVKLKTVVADVAAFSESIRTKIADLVAAMEGSDYVDIGDAELLETLLEQCKEFYDFSDYMDVLERIYALMKRLRDDE